jgi:hypothetical protein
MTTHHKKQAEFAERYARLMDEVRTRIDAIGVIRRELSKHVTKGILHETEYLQLRIICELITVGCLIAHGDIPETRAGKLRSAKYPTVIIPELERLQPDFFPVPFDLAPDGITEIEVKEKFLTKKGLLDLYAECGDAVHRGALKAFLRKGPVVKVEQVGTWQRLLIRLLAQHKIRLAAP